MASSQQEQLSSATIIGEKNQSPLARFSVKEDEYEPGQADSIRAEGEVDPRALANEALELTKNNALIASHKARNDQLLAAFIPPEAVDESEPGSEAVDSTLVAIEGLVLTKKAVLQAGDNALPLASVRQGAIDEPELEAKLSHNDQPEGIALVVDKPRIAEPVVAAIVPKQMAAPVIVNSVRPASLRVALAVNALCVSQAFIPPAKKLPYTEAEFVAIFKAIYTALAEGNTSHFKNNSWMLRGITCKKDIVCEKGSTREMANKLALAFTESSEPDISKRQAQLFHQVRVEALKKSGIFSVSVYKGETFFRASSLTKALQDQPLPKAGEYGPNSRTAKIMEALQGVFTVDNERLTLDDAKNAAPEGQEPIAMRL